MGRILGGKTSVIIFSSALMARCTNMDQFHALSTWVNKMDEEPIAEFKKDNRKAILYVKALKTKAYVERQILEQLFGINTF